jgi:hypothetical protein
VIRQRSVSAKIAVAISSIIHGAAAMNAMATPPFCSRRVTDIIVAIAFTQLHSLQYGHQTLPERCSRCARIPLGRTR